MGSRKGEGGLGPRDGPDEAVLSGDLGPHQELGDAGRDLVVRHVHAWRRGCVGAQARKSTPLWPSQRRRFDTTSPGDCFFSKKKLSQKCALPTPAPFPEFVFCK